MCYVLEHVVYMELFTHTYIIFVLLQLMGALILFLGGYLCLFRSFSHLLKMFGQYIIEDVNESGIFI